MRDRRVGRRDVGGETPRTVKGVGLVIVKVHRIIDRVSSYVMYNIFVYFELITGHHYTAVESTQSPQDYGSTDLDRETGIPL